MSSYCRQIGHVIFNLDKNGNFMSAKVFFSILRIKNKSLNGIFSGRIYSLGGEQSDFLRTKILSHLSSLQ